MIIQDYSALVRGKAEAVVYTGGDRHFVTRCNQQLVDRFVALKRMREDEAFAKQVRAL